MKRKGCINILIIGMNREAEMLIHEIGSHTTSSYNIVGYLNDYPSQSPTPTPYLGRISDLQTSIAHYKIDEVYNCLANSIPEYTQVLITQTEKQFARFYFVSQSSITNHHQTKITRFGSLSVTSYRREPLEHIFNRTTKRLFDIVISLIVVLTILPIATVIIWTITRFVMPGPLFFVQQRTSINGKNFICYKFRSMIENKTADTLQASYNDKRITRFGSLLRHSSIDELPQFLNVLKGEMSIVGPRPHMVRHTNIYSQIIDKYMVRHFVKPGITGWAQINGWRGETRMVSQMEKRVEYDVWYIENWSLALDIRIILKTPFILLNRSAPHIDSSDQK